MVFSKESWTSLTCLILYLGAFVNSFTTLSPTSRTQSSLLPSQANDDDHFMASSSFLSHVMLKVPSVDKTIKYWKEKGGRIRIAKEKPGTSNGEAELSSAFLELGCNQPEDGVAESPVCFALELVATDKENYSVGNTISYIGVSMLLQFQNNLLGAITGDKPEAQGDEPNGIPVQSAASAPGDFLARFSLKSKDLTSTYNFYTSVLGMEAKAQDEKMVCLRYDNDCFPNGVPTTLVFDITEEEIYMGDCFDHLAITTKTSIDEIYGQCQNSGSKIFMNPTDMFGKKVMGLIDPNGYKVVIASS